MLYRVLYSRLMDDTTAPALVEDDIEAESYEVGPSGSLTFSRYEKVADPDDPQTYHSMRPFFSVPNGAWIMVEPTPAEGKHQEGRVVARTRPTVGPSGLVIPR